MQTELHPSDPATGTTTTTTADGRPDGRSPAMILIGLAIVVVLAIGGVLAATGGDDPTTAPPAGGPADVPADAPAVELSLGEGAGLASCLPVDAAILADMSTAFAATATAVEGEEVTLAVDRWYAGGDADTVVLHAPAGLEALIGGFDLQVGQQYLITAAEGTVNYCGYSGAATPELQALFDQAFPA